MGCPVEVTRWNMITHFRCLPSQIDAEDWDDLMEYMTVLEVAIQQGEYTPLF